MDVPKLAQQLTSAPGIFEKSAAPSKGIPSGTAPTVELPMPNGKTKTFRMFKTHPMHPDLAAQFPEIQSWHGKGEDGVSAVALTISPAGLIAMIVDERFERSFIEPDAGSATGNYVSYCDVSPEFQCEHASTASALNAPASHPLTPLTLSPALKMMMSNNPLALGDKLRTHRLAVAATGEFTAANGGVAGSMAVIVGLVNQINLLYIREFAINFQIIANNNLIIYTNPATDPYVNDGNWNPDLANNNTAINAVIGSANYDIGHLMQNPTGCPDCGGWAGAGPCTTNKAAGMSVNSYSVMIHEMGHQFSCPHTTDSGSPDRYDHPAIGNTIMGGNGPGTVFHINSAEKVAAWVEDPGYCVPGTNTNNNIPMVTAGAGGMSIPKSTPFQLSGSATDPDPNTTLLYNWQQYNNEMTYNVVNNRIIPVGNVPVFRNFNPSPTGNVRTIPRIEDLVSNTYPFGLSGSDTLNWETLPNYSRSLTFRLVARDYEMTGGAFDYGELTFSVDGNSGPFIVTSPNTGNPTWTAGNNVTVTWNVANTNNAPVSCANVHLKLSVDGGYTYPYTLVSNTPNDGTQTFTLPAGIPGSTQARVRVECATYTNVVFFDISNQNFTISSACAAYAAFIAPATNVTAPQGSPSLDLALAPLYGNGSGTAAFNVPGTGTPAVFPLFNEPQTACVQGCCELFYNTYQFQVDKAGTYTFGLDVTGGGLAFMSVHNGAFNPANVCSGFLTSYLKEDSGGVGNTNPFEASLTPGVTYTMVFHPFFQNTVSGTVSFTNSVGGTVVVLNQGLPVPPASDYGYTYLAVNQATGLIAAVSQQADFTGLAAGTYRVHGLSYKSANPPPAIVNPATLVGMSMSGALGTFQCIAFSANYASITVTGGGGCTPPTVTAPTLTQPTCGNPSGTIVVNASGTGTREYSVDNDSTWQTSATFSGLTAGSYNIKVRLQANPTCMTTYSGNPVVLNAPPAPPTVNAPTVTQPPSCAVPTGTIVVNATGSGDLEYSKDNGTNWQLSATFSNLVAGSYTLKVRLKLSPTCLTAFSGNPVVINPAPTAPTVTAPTLTQPTCAVPTGTIVVNASGGTLDYSIDDGANWQASATFPGLGAGSYNLRARLQANPSCFTAYANNPVVINAAPAAPTVNAPTVTQPPNCANQTGTIVVNATGSGALQYSVNNGTSWQASATFSSLPPGSYLIKVRLQSDPACMTAYSGNPVVLNVPAGCCTTYASTDVPKAISATGNPTVTSTLNIPASGVITDVNVIGLDIDHTYINDLRVKLKSPANTERILLNQICGDHDDILMNLDEESANTYASIPCPPNGGTYQPNQTLSPFDGQNLNGTWTLTIEDLANQDGGTLQAWSLQVCTVPTCTPPTVNAPTLTQPTCAVPTGTIVVNASGNGTLEYSKDNGANWQASATFANLGIGNYTLKVRLLGDPACMTAYGGNPVVINAVGSISITSVSTTQPTCNTPSGTIAITASASGASEYSIDNGATWFSFTTFTGLSAGSYNVKARLTADPTCEVGYGSNPVTVNAPPTCCGPGSYSSGVSQPSCSTPTGVIYITASGGSGNWEYSVDNGANWQTSGTFLGLVPGTYTRKIRVATNPSCMFIFSSVTLNAPPPAPTVNAPTVTQPSGCANLLGTIVVNASGSGALNYSIDNGASWQSSATFDDLPPGDYNIKVREESSPDCMSAYGGNPVTINTAPGAPVVTAPTVTQPDCADPLGVIVVNATGGGTLEYSVNDGVSWQVSATFANLDIGGYYVKVRLQADPTCVTDYAANPVLLNANDAPTFSNSCIYGDYIQDFTFGAFSNLNTGCGNGGVSNYSSYFPTGPNAVAGQTYSVTVKSNPTYGEHHAVFIDLNQDGDFTDAGEFFPIGFADPDMTVTADVTIPLSALTGTSVLRVRCGYDAPLTAADGCGTNLNWGEVEDYNIFITNTTCPTPTYSEACSVDFIDDFSFGAFSNIGTGCPLTGLPTNLSNYLGTGPTATLSATYPVTVRVGPEAGGEWVGVYVDWNQNNDYLDAGEFYNLGHADANSTVTANILTPANAMPGVSTIRVRCVFAFELTAADACSTQFGYGETEDYSIFICSPPIVSAPTLTQPSDCAAPTGTIVVNSAGGGLEYSIDNGANWQTSNTFSGVAIGAHFISVRREALPLCGSNYAGNPVFLNNPASLPTLNSVAYDVPDCNASDGAITINASGTGTLEYSINNGGSWQTNSSFGALPDGSYDVKVRSQANPACIVTYSGNPIVLNCCALPTYANDCTTGDFIQDFTFGAFSNLGTGCSNPGASNYSPYPGMGPTVQVSETYNVTL